METVVVVAIAALAVIFIAAFTTMVVLCRHKYCHKVDWISRQLTSNRSDVHLISPSTMDHSLENADLELGVVDLNVPSMDMLSNDEKWIIDASGLIPHCLNLLRNCHQLAEKMVAMTMNNSRKIRTAEHLTEIVAVVRRIGPHVDDVVGSLYPPLDPRLLEARCTTLALSVSHLVMITKHICGFSGHLDWIDQSLADINESLRFLKMSCDWENKKITDKQDSGYYSYTNEVLANNESSEL